MKMKIPKFIDALLKWMKETSVSGQSAITAPSGKGKPSNKNPDERDVKVSPSDAERATGADAEEKPVDPRLRALRRFARTTNRERPILFAGREDQVNGFMDDLKERTEEWLEWRKSNPLKADPSESKPPPAWESTTWLFQGAPGAGKTSLLRHLREDIANNAELNVRVCIIEMQDDLYDDLRLKKCIAEAWIPGATADMEGTDTTTTVKGAKIGARLAASVGAFNAELNSSVEGSESTVRQRAGLAWDNLVQVAKAYPEEFPPVVVTFDEAQNLSEKAASQLDWLNKGEHGLPIVPVFGGLAWTEDHFGKKEMGLSRLGANRVHNLKALSPEACGKVVDFFFESKEFDIIASPEDKAKWKKGIIERSDGWPHHLTAGLMALAQELGKDKVNRRLDRVEEDLALENEGEIRCGYYDRRLASFGLNFLDLPYLAAAAIAYLDQNSSMMLDSVLLGGAIDRGHVRELALSWPKMNLAKDDLRLMLPEGTKGAEAVEAMIDSGMLHKEKDGELVVPIPSFVDHMKGRLNRLAARSGETPQLDPPDPGPGM